jgi:hypothetical protein
MSPPFMQPECLLPSFPDFKVSFTLILHYLLSYRPCVLYYY